jgi:hypothetical protein
VDNEEAAIVAAAVEAEHGHPGRKWEALEARAGGNSVQRLSEVVPDWLDLMWCLDQYRQARVPPLGMGRKLDRNGRMTTPADRLSGVYRLKGGWFSRLLRGILQNRTGQDFGTGKSKVVGYSQHHEIDIAWPKGHKAPLVCIETKVMGAPPVGNQRARNARDDFSNRRKEIKFAATDLKLGRRDGRTIHHWDTWRRNAYPLAFMVWGGRMGPDDRMDHMVRELEALVRSYMDGAGVLAWREDGGKYVPVSVPPLAEVHSADNVLERAASEVLEITPPGQVPPPPEEPETVVAEDLLPEEHGASE